MRRYWSIKTKAWVLFAIVSVVVISLMIGLTGYLYQELYLDREAESLETKAEQLRERYLHSEEHLQEAVEWIESTSLSKVLLTDDPMMLGSALPLVERDADLVILQQEREQLMHGKNVVLFREHEHLNTNLLGVVTPIMTNGMLEGTILIYTPVSELNEALLNILPFLLILGLIAFLLLFILMKMLEKQYIEPIVELDKVAHQLKKGNFDTRFQVNVNNELLTLADSFQSLAKSIKQEDEKKRIFIQNISHEMRTPLSYIKGYSELLQNDEQNQEYASIIVSEADRMNRLVNELIHLTHLEQDEAQPAFQPVVISEVLYEAVKNTKIKREKKEQILSVQIDETVIVNGDADRLLQVFMNLLDNAIVYTDRNGEIMVEGWAENDKAYIMVEDTGIGIPEEDISKIMERFYRIDKARTRKEGGFGIGLSIVKQIIDLHNGSITFQSAVNKGTKVTVSLPLYHFD